MAGRLGRSILGPGGGAALARRTFGCRALGFALAGLAAQVAPPAGYAGETALVSGARAFTVAVIDLDAVPALSPPAAAVPPQPAWRTSFGSERVTRHEPDANAASVPLAALAHTDAVLIHGVRAASPLRRLFPPRSWRLIVSRRLAHAQGGGLHTRPAATAIALRARPDLRVTARMHAPAGHAEADTGAPGSTLPSAATAVRIVDRDRTLWLAAVTLPSNCHEDGAPCPARDTLDAWREARRGDGEATLVGGRLTALPLADADNTGISAPCALHDVLSDIAAEPLPPAADASCISIVQLKN